jgi:hypothetical protein
MGSCIQEVNVRHHVGKLGAILCRLKVSFYFSISYCMDNFKCDSASNAPKCQLNNGVSIVQKLVVKLSNTSTTGGNSIVEVSVFVYYTHIFDYNPIGVSVSPVNSLKKKIKYKKVLFITGHTTH